ncbi:hypothetical protein RZS08_08655, partial [Arthrospira platensis SPKY1]|nr:hypothetical protein [Arthrospira platensis SPKY1]
RPKASELMSVSCGSIPAVARIDKPSLPPIGWDHPVFDLREHQLPALAAQVTLFVLARMPHDDRIHAHFEDLSRRRDETLRHPRHRYAIAIDKLPARRAA